MPVKVYRTRKFSTTHENKIFDQLIEKLKEHWENSDQLVVLLGNFLCGGNELDAAVIKNDSISVIDFKDYGGEITFSENSQWKANGKAIKFENGKNPLIQIRDNKYALLNLLKENSPFIKGNNVNLGHISGIVMFHQKIQFDSSSVPQKIKSWFHVTDIFNVTNLLNQITSREINLSHEEIEIIAKVFELQEYNSEGPIISIKENEFNNQKELINEFAILIDLLASIDIAQKECDNMIERHDEFIRLFYPKNKPEKQLNYNLNTCYKSFKKLQKEFIDIQKSNLNKQIDIIYNLNTNNGFILNEIIKGDDLKESLTDKSESIQIVRKVHQKYKIHYQPNNINTNILGAYKTCFYGRCLFDELPFIQLKNEFTKKEYLLNNLHAIYVICRFWFADDLIKHGLELDKGEVEHVYARGFSPKWLKNIEKKLNNGNPLSIKSENRPFLNSWQEENLKMFPKKKEFYSQYSEDVIVEVEIPVKIQEIFAELLENLNEVLTKNEFATILDFFNLNWIKKKSISISDIVVIDLKSHLLFNLGIDFNFVANKDSQPFHYFPNQSVYEPLYLTLLEEAGITTLDTFENNVEFQNSYKTLSQILVDQIDEVINAWNIYKSTNWYYTYDNYYFNNRLNIGSRDSGTDYKGTNVSKELLISSEQLKKYLNKIRNKKLYGEFHYTGIGDRYYIRALKHFKRLSLKDELINKEVANNKKIPDIFLSGDRKQEVNPNDQIIIGYNDIKKHIEQRLEPYLNPESVKEFGLQRTAGILLYGPPGCGKTYWANWISKYLNLPFEEIFRSDFGSTYVDGAMKGLSKKLDDIEKKAPVAIFFDEFDSIGKARDGSSASGEENRKVVNTLLQRIPKLIEKGVVVLAATNFINDLDSAIVRPGRFDLHLSIFPPLPNERSKLILYNMTSSSPAMLTILSNNFADEDYWNPFTELMFLFSNSHVIDFCNELKGFFYNESKTTSIEDIVLSDEIIVESINAVKSKIRIKDVELYTKFFSESMNLSDIFPVRMDRLKFEIDSFLGKDDNEYRPVGFRSNKKI